MPDILAIVSKRVFETEAAAHGVGDVWPTRAYASTNKALAGLADGGSLFLVTVRPNNGLWLVAILEKPKASRGQWRAAENVVPITDVTAAIGSITFANGKGLVRDDKLAMSLQTPRALAAEAAVRLRGTRAEPVVDVAPPPVASDRPAAIPPDAVWDAAAEEWQAGETDGNGARQRVWRFWRADGSLRGECSYRDHEPHGVNRRFHPDGTVASEGEWRDGRIYDATMYTAAVTDEPPLPPGIARAVYRSRDGRTNETIEYYDAGGRAVDGLGVPVPARPAGVAATARYFSSHDFNAPDGSIGGWVDGRIERGTEDKIGHWRWWSTSGALLHEERYTERGRRIDLDRLDATIERFCLGDAAPPAKGDEDREPDGRAWSRRYDLGKVWCDDVHATMRSRLGGLPAAFAREYVGTLLDNVEQYGRGWTMKVAQHAAIIDVVDDWEAREPDAGDADAGYLLAAGTRAAVAVGDRERVARWWPRVGGCKKPGTKEREATGLFRGASEELAELKARVAAFLAKPKPLTAKATDAQLVAAALARFGGESWECLIRDRKSGEAWLHGDRGSLYFDGVQLVESNVIFDDESRHDHVHVAAADSCDERVVLWPGKHGWLVLQRYGRAVLWHQAKYYASRGQPEVERLVWFRAPSPASARRLMGLIGTESPARAIDAWFDKKVGVIVRQYSGDGTTRLGVHDNKLVTGKRVIETLASHAAAVAAFEAIEIERLRNGSYIERFRAWDPRAKE